MRAIKTLTLLASAILVLGSATATAQGREQGGQHGTPQGGKPVAPPQQQRQAERAMSQDRAMEQERLQSRERDRTQAQAQQSTQSQAPAHGNQGIYGGNLMTVEERNQYREQLRRLEGE